MGFFDEKVTKIETKPIGNQKFVSTIRDAIFFRDVLGSLNTVNSEPSIYATPEGLSSKFMDNEHYCMMMLDYPKSVMDEFYPPSEKVDFCLTLDSLLKKNVFRDIKKETSLKLSLDDKNVTFELRDRFTRKFQVPSLDVTGEDVPLPKTHETVKVKIVIDSLLRVINNCEDLGEKMVIETNCNGVSFKNLDKEQGDFNATLEKGSEDLLLLETERDDTTYSVALSLNFLKPVVQSFKKLTDLVTLEFDTDKPLKVTPELPMNISLTYFQAPYMRSE